MSAGPERVQTLAEVVRARRLAARLSKVELAELAGVGRRALSELEAGKPTLRLDVANRVLAVFGLCVGAVPAPREPLEWES